MIDIVEHYSGSPGKGTVYFVKGFLTEKDNSEFIIKSLEKCFIGMTIKEAMWDSGNFKKIIKKAQKLAVPIEITTGSSGLLAGSAALSVAACADWMIRKKSKAKKTGDYLAQNIKNDDGEIYLIGHSLGCRVIYYFLRNKPAHVKVKKIIFLGGAVDRNRKDWDSIINNNPGIKIDNYYYRKDQILSKVYKVGFGINSEPIGIKPLEVQSVNNFSVKGIVSGHENYWDNLIPVINSNKTEPLQSSLELQKYKYCRECDKKVPKDARYLLGNRFKCKKCDHRTHKKCGDYKKEICNKCLKMYSK